MEIYQLTRIGEHHINHCEDYSIVESLGPDRKIVAVMDGCTMGTDSYFASTMVGKLLRKIAIEKNYQLFVEKNDPGSIEQDLKDVLHKLVVELRQLKNQLMLKDDELLTTLLLAVVDFQADKGIAMVVGDGLICINGKMIEFEQDNIPDYLGYHLGEEFEAWYQKQKQIVSIETIHDISISTDGIFTFSKYDKKSYSEKKDPIEYLLIDKENEMLDTMLSNKMLYLERHCGLKPTDDIGIIRIMNRKM